MHYMEHVEAGHRVFGLWEILPDGKCGCGQEHCKVAGKHPRASNWQHTPEWSEEQLETLEAMGHFESGYGVVVSGLLVVDIDERNGGLASYARLVEDFPEVVSAGMIVETGSGDGSKHLYFSVPEGVALRQHVEEYKGIDFKSSGYVVGAGSRHRSGKTYRMVYGTPHDIEEAPAALLDFLKKHDKHRAILDGKHVDVSEQDIAGMLSYIPNRDEDYELYIRVGMAVHHATGGNAQHLWDEWSSLSHKHNQETNNYKWHSFGKMAEPVTLGTLTHYATKYGWKQPVEFASDIVWLDDEPEGVTIDTTGVDLLRPPGFVGKICEWVNARSRYPRESLAVAASLATISSVAGMRYKDPEDGITPNLFLFGVAGSATGKESILKSHTEMLRSAGVAAAVHGGIKSEQEIYRNLTRHQAAFYVLDELGEQLGKIQNARSKGTSAYLEGVIGAFMSIYSKAGGHALITGDMKEEIRKDMGREVAALEKKISENEATEHDRRRLEDVKEQLSSLDSGLENPYLCMFGLTTPERFEQLMDFDMAVNGFLGRSLIFKEREDNPMSKERGTILKGGVPDDIAMQLQQLYSAGYSELGRVERKGEYVNIETTAQAMDMLQKVNDSFWEMAESVKNKTGLTAIPRRGYEQVAKVSMVLAIPEGLRTHEHVRWAYALVRRDIMEKMNITNSNSTGDREEALISLIMSLVTKEHGETIGRIRNKAKKYRKEDVDKMVNKLVEQGVLRMEEMNTHGAGRKSEKYFDNTQ